MTSPLPSRWLISMRWWAVALQAGALAAADLGFGLPLPRGALLGVMGAVALSNAGLMAAGEARVARWIPAILLVDIAALTALLALTGGPSNPFSVLYVIHIALAAVLLGAWWSWVTALAAAVGYGVLFFVSDVHLLHRAGGSWMQAHLVGMWGALVVTGVSIAWFVGRLAQALRAQEEALRVERERAERSARLAALTTLAAGTAHELATPLSTIVVAAAELEEDMSAAVSEGGPGPAPVAAWQADVSLIRREVERCRALLQRMSAEVGSPHGEAPRRARLQALVRDAVEELPSRERVRVEVPEAAWLDTPPRAMVRVLRSLLDNALRAGPGAVTLTVEEAPAQPYRVVVRVRDSGCGLSPAALARVGEPFYSTRAAGEGMGLGVFVARRLAEDVGGGLQIESALGEGTCVTVTLPGGVA